MLLNPLPWLRIILMFGCWPKILNRHVLFANDSVNESFKESESFLLFLCCSWVSHSSIKTWKPEHYISITIFIYLHVCIFLLRFFFFKTFLNRVHRVCDLHVYRIWIDESLWSWPRFAPLSFSRSVSESFCHGWDSFSMNHLTQRVQWIIVYNNIRIL